MTVIRRFARRLARNRAGVAMTEMALAAPFLLTASLYGIEVSNYALVTMQVNQTAIHIADNASRIGDISQLQNRKIYESDLNDILLGSNAHNGDRLELYENGRVILSSLEVDPDSVGGSEQQYIHWQRCKGKKVHPSSYGDEGDGLNDASFRGMGPNGRKVKALSGGAVMFVEIAYDYQPIVSASFVGSPTIETHAAFTVRSSRDLSEVYQRDEDNPDAIQSCNKHDGIDTIQA